MQQPNQHGVYEQENSEDVARQGRAFAAIHWCQCTDGLYRFAISMQWSLGGFGGPITDRGTGYTTAKLAQQEAMLCLLGRFPTGWPGEGQTARDELAALRRQIESRVQQPMLF